MTRMPLAAVMAAMAAMLAACASPAPAQVVSRPADPWATLHPWDHSRPEVKKLPDGVEYIVIRKGDGKGERPTVEDNVEVHYDGRLASSGLTIDSSYERGETFIFKLNQVIPGWSKGVQEMQPGDTFMFWIPWDQAYGEDGRPPQIYGKADLMFLIELVNVMPAAKSDPAGWAKVTPWPADSSGVVGRPSGLEYLVLKSGDASGVSPTDADVVLVHFEGRIDGVTAGEDETAEDVRARSVVFSTFEEDSPREFPVADLVPGWSEAMKLMRRGDRWMVRMPSHLLYGEEGEDPIPPDATVIYEIELLDFAPLQ